MRLRSPILVAVIALFVTACASPGGSGSPEESSPASQGGESEAPSESDGAAASFGTGDMTSVFDLNNGDCFNSAEDATVEEVEVTDCDNGHEYEIYFAVDYDAGSSEPYPGADAVTNFVNEQCTGQFESFVGLAYDDSELYIYYLAPTEDSWGGGDREVLCALYWPDASGANQALTGSMEGSNR